MVAIVIDEPNIWSSHGGTVWNPIGRVFLAVARCRSVGPVLDFHEFELLAVENVVLLLLGEYERSRSPGWAEDEPTAPPARGAFSDEAPRSGGDRD
jgi:hypothetical protein